jgi:hypothetical protein
MATAEQAVKQRLASDATMNALLTGGIWTRDIRREGRGATAAAFDNNLFLMPTVSIESGEEIPSGAVLYAAYMDQVSLHFYCPADEQRRGMITQAYERAVKLIKRQNPDNLLDVSYWWYINDDGRRMFPLMDHSATRFYPSEVFIGCSEKIATFRFKGTRLTY